MRSSAAALLLVAACAKASGDGASAQLQVKGATYVAGELQGGDGGPDVVSTYARNSWITPGSTGILLSGTLGPGATAVLLGMVGDQGYWILPASPPDTQTPDQPMFTAWLGFAASVSGAQVEIRTAAVDLSGRAGAAASTSFSVVPRAPPAGALVVELGWDTEADLDLHVVDPLGNELWSGDLTTPVSDPTTGSSPGIFGFDSNAGCVIDGLSAETASWMSPPAGTYVVKVDDYALCQATVAHWNVVVLRDGEVRMQAQGVATPAGARFVKGRGAGIEVLSFTWQ